MGRGRLAALRNPERLERRVSTTSRSGRDNSLTGVNARPAEPGWRLSRWHNRTFDQWFNPAAFQASPAGTFGNLGRNIVSGTEVRQLSTSDWCGSSAVREGIKLELRAEAFNVINHANLDTTLDQLDPYGAQRSETRADHGRGRSADSAVRVENSVLNALTHASDNSVQCTTTRLRPFSLAIYSASSASRTRTSGAQWKSRRRRGRR